MTRHSPPKIWEERDGNARPTKERASKAGFELIDGEDAGVQYAETDCSDALGAMCAAGLITDLQRDAGRRFEAVKRGGCGSPSTRSCIDMTPVGHEAEEDTEEEVMAQAEWRSLRAHLPMLERKELERVCWAHFPPRSHDRLRSGLDLCVALFDMRG